MKKWLKILQLILLVLLLGTHAKAYKEQTGRSICSNCETELRNKYISQGKTLPLNEQVYKESFVIIPTERTIQRRHQKIFLKNTSTLGNHSSLGKELMIHLTNHYKLRNLHQIMTLYYNLFPLEPEPPRWEQKKRQPHDLFGFFSFYKNNGNQSPLIAISNYQHPHWSVYTIGHEIFHLFDSYRKTLAKNTQNEQIKSLISEYRAFLAELKLYLQIKNSKKDFWESDFHERFLKKEFLFIFGDQVIKKEDVFRYVLNMHFPTKERHLTRDGVIDPNRSITISKAAGKYYNYQLKELTSYPDDLPKIKYRILSWFVKKVNKLKNREQENKWDPDYIMRLSYKKDHDLYEDRMAKNHEARNDFFKWVDPSLVNDHHPLSEYFKTKHFKDISNINQNSLSNDPIEGDGPKPRNAGD